MTRQSAHAPIVLVDASGVAIEVGSISSFTSVEGSPYAGIRARTLSLRERFRFHGLDPRNSQSLTRILDMTDSMWDSWNRGAKDEITFPHLWAAAHAERITTAALSAPRGQSSGYLFRDLLKGSLDLLGRTQSKAKDTLWELELLGILVSHDIDAAPGEPDLSVRFFGAPVGFACKKIYSERNVSKVLSNAVAQIEREGRFGIIALNLDDLLPANTILRAQTMSDMTAILAERNYAFLRTHERNLRRYLTPGRAISVLVSSGTIADVENAKNRFLNARQTTVWQIPGIPEAKAEQMNKFLSAMSAQYYRA